MASVRCILTGMACAHVYVLIYGAGQYLSIVTISVINTSYWPMRLPKPSSLSVKGASALGSVKSIGRVVSRTPNMSFFQLNCLNMPNSTRRKLGNSAAKYEKRLTYKYTEHPFERFYDSSQASLIWQLEYHFLCTQVAI